MVQKLNMGGVGGFMVMYGNRTVHRNVQVDYVLLYFIDDIK